MGKISIVKIINTIKDSLYTSLELIGGVGAFLQPDDIVLLKPNLNDSQSFTSPELVSGLIEILFDFNIKNIFIAESTFGNEHITADHFNKTGYKDMAEKFGIDLININKSRVIEKTVRHPFALDRLQLGAEVDRATKIINLPVMKVHYATGVTLCLKNLKGLLAKEEKKHFHEIGLEKAIVDLNNTIPVALNIIDGTNCMESMGPKGGDIFNLGLLIAGGNSGEVDAVGAEIMGFDVKEINHIHDYIVYNNIDPEAVEIVGNTIAEVRRPFKRAEIKDAAPTNFTVHNVNACSACENALLLSFKFMHNPPNGSYHIFIGPKVENTDYLPHSIGFGSCCKMKDIDVKIKGCPPYPPVLARELEEREKLFYKKLHRKD
jgi:uncharacterized protein (DUF362 family)